MQVVSHGNTMLRPKSNEYLVFKQCSKIVMYAFLPLTCTTWNKQLEKKNQPFVYIINSSWLLLKVHDYCEILTESWVWKKLYYFLNSISKYIEAFKNAGQN